MKNVLIAIAVLFVMFGIPFLAIRRKYKEKKIRDVAYKQAKEYEKQEKENKK
jgi:hypothetical protein